MKAIKQMFVDDARCIKCDDVAIRQLSWTVNTPYCLCQSHHEEAVEVEKVFEQIDEGWSTEKTDTEDDEKLTRRLVRVGLTTSIKNTLGINSKTPDGYLSLTSSFQHVGNAVTRYLDARPQGVLVLSGSNGTGKSTAAGFAAWRSKGRFVPRSEWIKLTTWEKDEADIHALVYQYGVLVLDEVLQSTSFGDSTETMRVLNIVCTERHDNHRATILTTRSTKEMFFDRLGNDILDRSREFASSGGSGFVEANGKSLRGVA